MKFDELVRERDLPVHQPFGNTHARRVAQLLRDIRSAGCGNIEKPLSVVTRTADREVGELHAERHRIDQGRSLVERDLLARAIEGEPEAARICGEHKITVCRDHRPGNERELRRERRIIGDRIPAEVEVGGAWVVELEVIGEHATIVEGSIVHGEHLVDSYRCRQGTQNFPALRSRRRRLPIAGKGLPLDFNSIHTVGQPVQRDLCTAHRHGRWVETVPDIEVSAPWAAVDAPAISKNARPAHGQRGIARRCDRRRLTSDEDPLGHQRPEVLT